jgi:hypothetical protein
MLVLVLHVMHVIIVTMIQAKNGKLEQWVSLDINLGSCVYPDTDNTNESQSGISFVCFHW